MKNERKAYLVGVSMIEGPQACFLDLDEYMA